jgi:putative heme-binding domain-containing protein
VISPGALFKNQWVAEYVMPRMIERWCRDPLQDKLSAVERTLASIESSSVDFKPSLAKLVVEAFERAYQNRSLKSVPRSVVNRLAALGVPSLTLEIRQERADSIQTARKQIQDSSTNVDQRIALIQLAGEMRLRDMLPVLIRLVESPEKDQRIVQASLSALASFEDEAIAKTILDKWSDFSEATRSVAGATLAKRKSWVGQWLQACEDKRIAAESLPLDAQRAMRWIDDETIQEALGKLYASVAGFSLVDANREAKRYEALIDAHEGDPYRGKAIYKAHCGRCHKLFDEGGNIGPDLTGYQRDQVSTLLRNIIAPSLEIREGYETVSIVTEAGTVVTGFVENETDQEIVVKGTDGQPTTISLDEIQQRKKQALSIMPERILESLTSEQVSDLLSYLRSTQPLLDKN